MLSRRDRKAPDERTLSSQVLQQMIILQLQLQEAERIGVSVDNVTLERAVESEAQRRGLTLEQLRQARERENEDFREFRRHLRERLTLERLVQREVVNRIEVSEREIEELLKAGDAPKMMQLQYRLRHILIIPDPVDDDEKVRRKLLNIKRQLENGADFARFARRYSQDPLSSIHGGELDWTSLDGYAPEFVEAAGRGRGGGIVGPFRTAFGWHVLEVIDVRKKNVGNDEARRRAIERVRKEKLDESMRLWLLRLRENSRIEVRI